MADDGAYAVTPGARNANWDIIGSVFDFSAIPAGSTINSISVEVQYKLSTTASAATLTLQAQNSGALSGTAATSTAEPTTDTIWTNSTTGTWTYNDLTNLQVLLRVRRTSTTACNYSIDYLAANVNYTALHAASAHLTGSGSIDAAVQSFKLMEANLTGSGIVAASLTGTYSMLPNFDGTGEISTIGTLVYFDGYILEKKVNDGTFAELVRIPLATSAFEDCDITTGNTYYYRIKRYRREDGAESDYSNIVEITPDQQGIVTAVITISGTGALAVTASYFRPAYTDIGGVIKSLTKAQTNIGGSIVNLTKAQQNISGTIVDIWISE